MDEEKLRKVVDTWNVSACRSFQTIGSTNDEAQSWADEGAADFSLVIADEQTKGRGRFNRHWVSKPGACLAFTLILQPNAFEKENLPLFAPLCGLAVRDALAELLGLDAKIKWPNDILINRKKCCGILVEAVWTGETLKGIIMGIGINISADSLPPSDDSLFSPTCLEDAINREVDRYQVLGSVLKYIVKWRPKLKTKGFFDHWIDHLAFKGEQVMIVQSEKQSIIGIEKGIDQKGNLVLIAENNEEMTFEVGDLHLRPVESS
jgi:BirA family biotin operon repressor/biotin-[acetyl-CoA-carboxylase] ligase